MASSAAAVPRFATNAAQIQTAQAVVPRTPPQENPLNTVLGTAPAHRESGLAPAITAEPLSAAEIQSDLLAARGHALKDLAHHVSGATLRILGGAAASAAGWWAAVTMMAHAYSVNPPFLLALGGCAALAAVPLAAGAASLYTMWNLGKGVIRAIELGTAALMDPLRESDSRAAQMKHALFGLSPEIRAQKLHELNTLDGYRKPPFRSIYAAQAMYALCLEERDPVRRCAELGAVITALDSRYRDYAVVQKIHRLFVDSARSLSAESKEALPPHFGQLLAAAAAAAGDGRSCCADDIAQAAVELAPRFTGRAKVELLLGARAAARSDPLLRATAEEMALGSLYSAADPGERFLLAASLASLRDLELESKIGLAQQLEELRPQLSDIEQRRADSVIRKLTPNHLNLDKRAKQRLRESS